GGNHVTTVKTYWPYGVGVEIDRGTAATELNWTHVDRLGNPVAMSTSTGTLREKLAYDAWGKRRTLDGAPVNGTPIPDTIDGVTDNRGYTGHEMLDQLDLVHMNGRIYDPLTARFMSADPLLQDPMNGQSYNRYSYVLNNPTNLTDPTGFFSIP
ncbi:MAG: RHS repeat-associated core domain-containing protein, partial [Burkholderiales bacterium]